MRAFGILWRRDWVDLPRKRLEGRQLSGSDTFDFADQDGIYVLYDRDRAIYVGRMTKGGLFGRLKAHTTGRFATRWDRFSWFGFREPSDDGTLRPIESAFGIEAVIEAMEAVLIETLELPQNRRRGDDFAGTEYDQVPDQAMEKRRVEHLLLEHLGLGR